MYVKNLITVLFSFCFAQACYGDTLINRSFDFPSLGEAAFYSGGGEDYYESNAIERLKKLCVEGTPNLDIIDINTSFERDSDDSNKLVDIKVSAKARCY